MSLVHILYYAVFMMISREASSGVSQVMTVNNSHIKAYLIGVSHADVALVLAGHIAVDGINIFRADQLIH